MSSIETSTQFPATLNLDSIRSAMERLNGGDYNSEMPEITALHTAIRSIVGSGIPDDILVQEIVSRWNAGQLDAIQKRTLSALINDLDPGQDLATIAGPKTPSDKSWGARHFGY